MIQPRPIGQIVRHSMKLTEDFCVRIPGIGTFWFAKGWEFEASIPFWAIIFLRLLPLSAKVQVASCIHDWLTCMGALVMPQKRADQVYEIVCLLDDCTQLQARVMYRALRVRSVVPYKITPEQREEALRFGKFVPEEELKAA